MVLWVGVVLLILSSGCAGSWNRMDPENEATLNTPSVCGTPLYFTYAIRENLQVKVTLENQKAYDAVQMGLYMLQHARAKDGERVPGIEEPDFFPEFFVMINVDISDGLLLITEEEAKNFARAMYLEYQKKVVPSDYLISTRKSRLLEDIMLPKPDVEKGLSESRKPKIG
jgi:hypothetical protein